jgi:bacterioferritin (cytochrome b1)
MDELVALLSDIVRAEYAQWMRYVYLSSLSYGTDTSNLTYEFEEHAYDELEHAKIITRWIVDLDGLPPTDTPPVEQFCGSVEDAIGWLIEAEIAGAKQYSLAYDLAALIGMHGLVHDIGEILSKEHEHISELENFVAPHMLSGGDTTLIVVAHAYKRYASNETLFKKYSRVAANGDINSYIQDILQLALYHYVYDYTPEKGREYLIQDTEKTVQDLWARRKSEDVRSALQFYKTLYEWVTSPDVTSRWEQLHDVFLPEWREWLQSDEQQEQEEQEKQISFEDIMKQVGPDVEAPAEAPAEEPEPTPEPARAQPPPPPPEAIEESRRPVQTGIEEKIQVNDSKPPSKQQFSVGVGDRIRNMDIEGEDYPAKGRPGRSKATVGVIDGIEGDKVFVTTDDGQQRQWFASDNLQIDANEREKYLYQTASLQ